MFAKCVSAFFQIINALLLDHDKQVSQAKSEGKGEVKEDTTASLCVGLWTITLLRQRFQSSYN